MNKKSKKLVSISIKTAVVVIAFIFIYRKLSHNSNLENFNELTSSLSKIKVWKTMGAVMLMMLLNWFLESLKWKYLVQRVEKISTWKAVESVFCGLTWAVFTPNRIGEYGGRVFFLSPRKRIAGVVAMGVGAFGQMVVTNVAGSLAILWFIGRFIPLNIGLHYAIAFLILFFCVFFILFYFNIRWLNNLLLKINFLKKYQRFFSILARYKYSELWNVFLFCVSRFVVFTTQYFLIIHLLIPGLGFFEVSMMVFIMFFIQSALPSLDLLDVGVRTMTASYFFSFITDQDVSIIAATACIWLINLIIPAILGSIFVFKLNFFGSSTN